MSISDLYSTGKHKQEIGHFTSIVKIAFADGKVTKGEEKQLLRVAKRLNISLEEFKLITKNPDKFPVNPPVSYNDRIERLYRLTKMIFADNNVDLKEVTLMRKIAIGLNFSLENAEKVCDEAIHLVMNNNDLDTFISAIKKVDSI